MIIETVPLRSDPDSWMQWLQNENYRQHFFNVLAATQGIEGTISECFSTATRITSGDDESWYREWQKTADLSKERGDIACANNNICTARSNWLRASSYYRVAETFLAFDDNRRVSIVRRMQSCSSQYLQHQRPGGEIVQIPYRKDCGLPGYFLRAPASPILTPVVICVGGPAHYKEEHLWKMPQYALARGLSLLLVDLPGQGAIPQRNDILGRHDVETCISHCVDYLIARGDVDEQQIAIYGEGLGAAFASRAAAMDHRFAAAVCDGGFWDIRERAYSLGWLAGGADPNDFEERLRKLSRFGLARRIKCPMLVMLDERDLIQRNEAIDLVNFYRGTGLDMDLRIAIAEETSASDTQIISPTVENEFVYDWIASRLGKARQRSS